MKKIALAAVLLALVVIAGTGPPGGFAAAGYEPGSRLMSPVAGAVLTQGFGCTSFEAEPVEPACPGGHWHAGIDLGVPEGTPVVAAAPGAVAGSGWAGGYGNRVVIDHGLGWSTLYAHLAAVEVVPGQHVARGDELGLAGSSGNSTGPHLHFEVRVDGRPRDPLTLLAGQTARSVAQGEES